MDYVSESAFKMGDRFYYEWKEGVDYIEIWLV